MRNIKTKTTLSKQQHITPIIVAISLVFLSILCTMSPVVHAADRFYARLKTDHFSDTAMVNVIPLSSRNSNPGDLPYDIVNTSMLWYDIQVTDQSASNLTLQPANTVWGQDLDSQIYLSQHLLPPNTQTPFDCGCLSSSQVLHAAITFDRGGEQMHFELNPFTTKAVTLDTVSILLQLMGDAGRIPFGLGETKAGARIIGALMKMPDLIDAGKELVMAFRSPDTGTAIQHAENYYGNLLKIAKDSPKRAELVTSLDKLLSNKWDITLATDLNNAIEGLESLVGKANAIYHLAHFLLDEGRAMGGLLSTSGYNPIVTLESVLVTPTNNPTTVSVPTGTGNSNNSPSAIDKSQLISNSTAVTVQPGQQFNVNFRYANIGTSTWTDANGYALVCDTYYHNSSNCMGGSAVGLQGTNVSQGQQIAFTVTLTAPSTPGTYTTWWDMAHHNSIFGDNNSFIQVTVQAAARQPTPGTDNSQWVSNSPTVTVQPGQQFTVQFTYQNDGTTTWSDGGGYALSCDTHYHSNSNCMGSNPVGLGGQNVVNRQQVSFNVTLVAPSTPGTYTTWWDMTHNGSIFGNNNSYVTVVVQAPAPVVDNSQWISNSPTMTVLPGQQFTVQLTYQNDGTTTWSDNSGYALACDTYYHQNSNCMGGGPVGIGSQSVAPNQQFSFVFNLTAPSIPGTYTTWWDMTHNGSIFGNNNSYITVVVQTMVDNSQWVSNSPTITVQPGQQFTVEFTYRNDGTTTWSDSGSYALSCDTYNHKNSNCMGGNPIGFGGQSVAQGQQFTFTFTLVAPSAPGTYTTWWDMTVRGGIFGNNNSYITVNVA